MTHWDGCWLQGPEHYECAVKFAKHEEREAVRWKENWLQEVQRSKKLEAELAEARRELEAVNGESHADRCAQFAVDADADATSYGINRAENAWWRSTASPTCTLEAQLVEARRALGEIAWSNDSQWQADRARAALEGKS
jgi:hypothetical protein